MPAIGWIRLCTLIKTMLSISEAIKGVNDAVNYHIHQGKEAYYLAGIGQEGRWLGGAVEPLKLPDTVTAKAFRNLLHGYSPDGHKPLVQNAGHPDRDAGWDLTFSVPKAVSVLWAMSPPAVRAEIEASQRHAVKIALGQAEEIFGFTRRGQGGKRHEHAALLFAAFEEYVLRAKAFQSILRNRVQRGGVLADRAGLIRTGASGSGVESRAVSHHETRKDPSCICSPEELNQWLPSS